MSKNLNFTVIDRSGSHRGFLNGIAGTVPADGNCGSAVKNGILDVDEAGGISVNAPVDEIIPELAQIVHPETIFRLVILGACNRCTASFTLENGSKRRCHGVFLHM